METKETAKKEYEIDASGQRLGRVASRVAMLLMGKNSADYAPNVVSGHKVHVINASKLEINSKKRSEKLYNNFTGYPGGLKTKKMETVIDEKGYGEIVKRAVKGMLPDNKLKPEMLKNLVVTD